MSGASGESLQFLIIQSQSVPAEYIVFLFEASQPAAPFYPGASHKTHKNKHTLRNRSCVFRIQPPADCEVTNEHCHPAKHLLALLLQLCTKVLPFCFRVGVCQRVRCAMLKILPHSGGYSAKLRPECISFSFPQQICRLPLAMWKQIYLKETAESCITDMDISITSTHLAKQSTACHPAPFTLLGFARSSEGH